MNVTLSDLVFHTSSPLLNVKNQMQFATLPPRTLYPSRETVDQMHRILRNSSCAVVGASLSLLRCRQAIDICSHDVVIRVNHHKHRKHVCNRTDVQVVNSFACISQNLECERPRLFRLRTEWNGRFMAHYQKDEAWLSSGFVTNFTRHVLTKKVRTKRCCNTAGGSAVAFAIHACRFITIFGLGNPNTGNLDNPNMPGPWVGPPVHNLIGEDEWYNTMKRDARIVRKC